MSNEHDRCCGGFPSGSEAEPMSDEDKKRIVAERSGKSRRQIKPLGERGLGQGKRQPQGTDDK